MSKMKQIHNLIADIRTLADDLEAVFSDGFRVKEENEEESPAEKPIPQQTQKVTLEEARAVLTDKNVAGKGEQVRELLRRHGGSKLSEIDPSHYAALLEEARAIT